MSIFFTVIGAIFCLAVSVALLAYAYGVVVDKRREAETARFYAAKEKAAREVGQSLRNTAYWFGESKAACTVLELIGNELRQNGAFDECSIRDAWRKALDGGGK